MNNHLWQYWWNAFMDSCHSLPKSMWIGYPRTSYELAKWTDLRMERHSAGSSILEVNWRNCCSGGIFKRKYVQAVYLPILICICCPGTTCKDYRFWSIHWYWILEYISQDNNELVPPNFDTNDTKSALRFKNLFKAWLQEYIYPTLQSEKRLTQYMISAKV